MRVTEEQMQMMERGSSPRPVAPARPEVDPSVAEAMERGSRPPPPTTGEKFEEIGTGVAQGVVEGAAMTLLPYAGAKAGMAVGAKAGTLLGFPGIAAGGTLGFVAGAGLGALTTSASSSLFPDVPREGLTPYREAGKTTGISVAMAPWAFKIPVERAKDAALFLRNITPEMQSVPNGIVAGKTGEFIFKTLAAAGQTAKKYPKTFLASEMIASVGAGVGAGYAETRYPGESLPRFGAEALGGALAPGRKLFLLGGNTLDFLSIARKSFSEGSRQQLVADKLQTILKESGENPTQLLRRLEELALTDTQLSAAQITGSPALSALETTLARNNVQYSRDMQAQAKNAFRAHTALLRALNGLADVPTGSVAPPQVLKKVAEERQRHFTDMIQARLALAEHEAARLAARFKQDTPQNRAAIGNTFKDQVMDGAADVRAHEDVLWQRAIKESRQIVTDAAGNRIVQVRAVRPRETAEQYLDIVTSMTEARYQDMIPPVVKKQMAAFGITEDAIDAYRRGKLTPEYLETGRVPPSYLARIDESGVGDPFVQNVDVQDLINTRGDLLSFARDAAAKGNLAEASFFGRLAESLLDDLDQLNSPAYDAARLFSRTLNDVFTRTYAGILARGKTATGAERVPAELVIARAFSSNADLTGMRMREIQDAVGFMGRQYDDAVRTFGADSPQALELRPFAELAQQRVESILDAQQRVYMLAAAKTMTPEGRVNPARLSNFLEENRPMLEQLGIADDMVDAVRAENVFRALKSQESYINRKMVEQTAFAQVLAREDPTQAVIDVLGGKFPVKNFKRIAKLAKSGGPDAVEGLKSTLYDYAFTRAGGMEGFDPARYKAALFDPISPGQPSLVNILRNEGMISREEIRRTLQILRPMERIQAAQGNQRLMDELVANADVITEFGLRVMGSKIGRLAGPAGSSSLIAAQAGSSAVRNIFDKQPNILLRGIMEEATKDPQLMAMLLRKGRAADHNLRFARGLHGYLAAAGLNFSEFEEPLPQDDSPREGRFGPPASEMLWNMLGKQPPAPVTRGTPNLQMPTPPRGPAGEALERMPTDQGPAGPVSGPVSTSREMFQRLFPNEMS